MEEEVKALNCLTNEKVVVRHINKQKGSITDPRHVLFGGMANNAVREFSVPKLRTGVYVNVLTNNEKSCLERVMGLKEDTLSVYKKGADNFWSNLNPQGVNTVRLTKHDTILDLSNPVDYIKYKILLANKDFIAPSLQALQDTPKATYQFVLVKEDEEAKASKQKLSITAECYKEYGKIEDDLGKLRLVVETLDGRPVSKKTKIEFLQGKCYDFIQSNAKMFLKVVTDELLDTKVLLKDAIDAGLVFKRGDYLYFKADNQPICEAGEEPTFTIAAKYLSSPKRQEVKFALEAKLKEHE